jgi:hypothetical protein
VRYVLPCRSTTSTIPNSSVSSQNVSRVKDSDRPRL